MMNQDGQDLYRIGTVASLTGIAVERLRAWERRYGLEPAFKSGRTRFYSKDQLDQLGLIKRLVDQGHPISSIANLDIHQLRQRLTDVQQDTTVVPVTAPQVGLIGPNLLVLEQQQAQSGRIDVLSRWANVEAFFEDQSGTPQLDIIFAQLPVLSLQPIDFINDLLPSCKVIAVYQFATEDAVAQCADQGQNIVKWPLTWAEIEHLAITERGLHTSAPGIAARQFSDEELIAMSISSNDPSQRVPQLVELLQQTNAFISFAQACEKDGFTGGQALAEHLSSARSQLEYALEQFHQAHLTNAEGLPVQNINKIEKKS